MIDFFQMFFNDLNDVREMYSGIESGYFELSMDQWGIGSGVNGFFLVSFFIEVSFIFLRDYIVVKILNVVKFFY